MGPPIDGRYQPPPSERQNYEERPEEYAQEQAGEDTTDSPVPYSVRRRTYERVYQRNVSTTDEVIEQTPDYTTAFIVGMMDQDGVNVPDDLRARMGNVNKYMSYLLPTVFTNIY